MFPQYWGIGCHGKMKVKVVQDMFLKQSQTSLRNIVPEQLIQWSHVIRKLDGIASFVINGIEAMGEIKTNS